MDALQENEKLVALLLEQLRGAGGLRNRLALSQSLVDALETSNGALRSTLQHMDANSNSTHEFPLLALPDDVLQLALAPLLLPGDRLRLALTCKRMFDLVWPIGRAPDAWTQITGTYDIERSLEVNAKFVFQVAVSSHGQYVAFVDEVEGRATRFDAAATTSPNGFIGRINLWNVRTAKLSSHVICRKLIPRNWRCCINRLEFSPDNALVAVAGEHLLMPRFRHAMGLFRVIDDESESRLELVKRLYLDATGISSFAFSNDGHHLACSSRRGEIDIWFLRGDTEAITLQNSMIVAEAMSQFNVEVLNITYSPDGRLLISSSFDSAQQQVGFTVWDPFRGVAIHSLRLPNDGAGLFARSMPSISCDGENVALTRDGFYPNTVTYEVWNLSTKHKIYSSTESHIPSRGVIPYRKVQTMTCRFSSGHGLMLLTFCAREPTAGVAKRCVSVDAIDLLHGSTSGSFALRTAELCRPSPSSPCMAFIPPGSAQAEDQEWIHAWVCDSTSSNGAWAAVVTETSSLAKPFEPHMAPGIFGTNGTLGTPGTPRENRRSRLRCFRLSMRNLRVGGDLTHGPPDANRNNDR